MCRIPKHESLPALPRSRGGLLALGLLALVFAFTFEAGAEKTSGGSAIDEQTGAQQENIPAYVRALPPGYSLEGPLTVASASAESISFFMGKGPKPLVLSLKNARVSVKDAQNNALTFSAIIKGCTVFVSRSPDKKVIIIFVMAATEKEKGNDF